MFTLVECSRLMMMLCAMHRLCQTILFCVLFEPQIGFDCFCCHYAGMRKTYWTTCNIEPDIQHLSLDRRKFPSNFVVRPRDFNRLLANFQSSLQEITIIATDRTSLPSDTASEIEGKAVELRSYVDPTKGKMHISSSSLTLSHRKSWCFTFSNCRERFIAAHSTVDRSYRRVCAVYSHWRSCRHDIFSKRAEGITIQAFLIFLSFNWIWSYINLTNLIEISHINTTELNKRRVKMLPRPQLILDRS